MRITLTMTQNRMISSLNRGAEEVDRYTNMASSGKSMAQPSDDPATWADAVDLTQRLREMDTFDSNLDYANGWNSATDSTLSEFYDLMSQARSVAVSVGGDDEEARTAQIAQLEQILEQALNIANTQYNGMYLFGGVTSSSDSEVFTIASDGTVTYSGNTTDLDVRVGFGSNETMTSNISGEDAFTTDYGGSSINALEEIWNLKNALENDDESGITDTLAKFDAIMENVSAQQSVVGARLNSIEGRQTALANTQISETDRLSTMQDADIAETYIQLAQAQVCYQAAMQVTSMLNGMSLVNYL